MPATVAATKSRGPVVHLCGSSPRELALSPHQPDERGTGNLCQCQRQGRQHQKQQGKERRECGGEPTKHAESAVGQQPLPTKVPAAADRKLPHSLLLRPKPNERKTSSTYLKELTMALFIPTKRILSTSTTTTRRMKMEVVTRQLFLAIIQQKLREHPVSMAETQAKL